MNFEIKIGFAKERKIRINSGQTTRFLWEGENVLSTPSLISEMEETCRLLLKEQFISDPSWDSVGTIVDIQHIAATPVGAEVLLKSKVISVCGRRIMFEVEAFDDLEKIGEGRHERFIINIREFKDKFKIKQNKLGMLRSCKSIKGA
jgi:fluoroacetyl-CoA thioesterase